MALGLTAMDLVASPSLKVQVSMASQHFSKIIHHLKLDYPIIGRADCRGMAAGIELINQKTGRPDPLLARKISSLALQEPVTLSGSRYGLILSVGGLFENAFLLSPSLFMTEQELDLFDVLIRHYLDKTTEK